MSDARDMPPPAERPGEAAMAAAVMARATARRLMRTAWTATLATIDAASGHPYGSLVAVACEPDGTPILLLSQLAMHTRNLCADPRASLLFDGTSRGRGALTGARVTVVGCAWRRRREIARRTPGLSR